MAKNSKRSITVLEIGAGPSQPISRSLGENLLKNDKYRCSLIRINPIRERKSLYEWEQEEITKILKEHQGKITDDFKFPDFTSMDHKHIT